MKVTVAKSAGFCAGVQNAVSKALSLAEKYGKIYTLGTLVHNEQVTDYLRSNGVFAINIEDADNLKAGDVALIRAHGIPRELEAELKEKGVIVEDATCPVVKKIHSIVQAESEKGRDIVVVGDEKHDEVVGTVSYASDKVTVVGENSELVFSENPTSVVFQTTILAEKYDKIAELVANLQKKCGKSVGIFNTICYTTKARQEETCALASVSDAVLVLGSRSSANTNRLFQVASAVNNNVFFASTAEEALQTVSNKHIKHISIVAGASTPPWLIQEVTKLMSEIEFTDVTENVTPETEEKEVATSQPEQTKAEETAAPQEEKELTMEDIIASNRSVGYIQIKPGKRIKGTVLSADESGIFVAIGGKKDGFIDKDNAELEGAYDASNYKNGDAIEAIITGETNKDYVILSKKEVDARNLEDAEAEKALAAGDFDVTLTEVTKGGLRGRLGAYTVFVPASQLRRGYVQNLEDYKGKTLRVCLMPPKEKTEEELEAEADRPARKSRYLFASARMVIERERKEKEDAFWNGIHVHDIVRGKVKRFTTFGAFVSVNGHDCLAHISELSWNKINDPSTVLAIGEEYDFVVLKIDRENDKISLGFKQLQKKPYDAAAEKYPVGTVIKGKVERIFPYGAFISIDEGVDGLVHVSQISHNWIKDANEILKVGEEVEAKIIGFEENRITLSIKELLPVPEETAVAEDSAEGEDKPKRTSRVKKFEDKLADGSEKRERRPRKDAPSSEPKEWVSGSSSSSLGDLFKGLKLDLEEEEKAEKAETETAEEKPKKATRKKADADVAAEGAEEAPAKPKTVRKKKTDDADKAE